MKNFYTLLIAICTLLLGTVKSFGQTPISVQVTKPDTVKTCANNSFSAVFTLSGINHLCIDPFLDNNSTFGCGIQHGVYIDSVHLSGATLTSAVMDTATGKMNIVINASSSSSCTLTYLVHIDCSIISQNSFGHNFILNQVWTDPNANNTFSLNSGVNGDTLINSKVVYPFIIDKSVIPSTVGYLEQKDFSYRYVNSGNSDANMLFNFSTDANSYCGSFQSLGLHYKIGVLGTDANLTSGIDKAVNLPKNDTLFITQNIKAINSLNCISQCSDTLAVFKWRCNNSTAINAAFCKECQQEYNVIKTISNPPDSGLYIQRVTPVSGIDLSCANDSQLENYEFNIINKSDAALDTALIVLNTSSLLNQSLTIIPKSSLHIKPICLSCDTISTNTTALQPSLCSGFITDPLQQIKIVTHNLAKGDTINIKFGTFRCVEENDTALLNKDKYYDYWTFENSYGVNKCQDTVSTISGQTYIRNGISPYTASITNLKLNFTPTVSDLSSQSNGFGDSAAFEIELNGMGIDQQLFGTVNSFDSLRGYLRVTVDCDTGLRMQSPMNDAFFKYDSAGVNHYLYPLYFSSTKVDSNRCFPGKYYFYFDLANKAFQTILSNGLFDYELQSCCGGQNGRRTFNVDFHTLLNPHNNCASLDFTTPNPHWQTPPTCSGTGCAWLPLSGVKGGVVIHCPGCVTPGIVISSYKMERTSFGLQDSDNDGRADDSLLRINKNSAWYNNNSSKLKLHFSGLGDHLEDHLVAYFAQGDVGAGGYTYTQMLANGVQLPFLQLSRLIPAGLDTMKVLPDSFYVYIDEPNYSSPHCVDCKEFGVDSTKFKTQRIFNIKGNNISKFLTLDQVNNYYLYTFESKDSLGHWVGNLQDKSDSAIIYDDPIDSLKGFFETQQYRVRVFYSTCGNFVTSNTNIVIGIDDVRKESIINNFMWLSGTPKPENVFSSIFGHHNPANVSELHAANYAIPPDTSHPAIDTAFASKYYFNCENFDGIHYFFSHDARNESNIGYGTGCTKIINAYSQCSVADDIVNVYPYEYRPGSLVPQTFTVKVPDHYTIDSAFVRVEVPVSNNNTLSKWIPFHPHPTTGTVVVSTDSLPIQHCFKQSDNAQDTTLYFGGRYTSEDLQFYISPSSCDSTTFIADAQSIIIQYGNANNSCIPSVSCTNNGSYTNLMPINSITYGMQPNDVVSYVKVQDSVVNNTFCMPITITNNLISNVLVTDAPFYFIAIPDTQYFPYLTNWHYEEGNSTIYPDSQIIKIDSLLTTGEIHNGHLCADFKTCLPDSVPSLIVPFYVGWNCTGYPTSPFNPSAVCGAKLDTINIVKSISHIVALSQVCPSNYTLCHPFSITTCFESIANGNVYPKAFTLDSLQGLIVQSIKIDSSCSGAGKASLQYDSITHSYPITLADLDSIGYNSGSLSYPQTVSVTVSYVATCGMDSINSPAINFIALSYCGDTLHYLSQNFKPKPCRMSSGGSLCDSCFTIKKTASYPTIATGDPLTYSIVVCGNNHYNSTVSFHEFLPNDFTPTSTIPTTLSIPANGCDTVIVTGYYSTPATCPTYINTAQITTSNNKIFRDTVCVNVIASCLVTADSVFTNDTLPKYGVTQFNFIRIYLVGTIYISHDMTFNNCIVTMAPGAQIIVANDATLRLVGTSIDGCYSMWQGITLMDQASITVIQGSGIHDADFAIKSGLRSNIIINAQSSLENCVTGIYYPPLAIGNTYDGTLSVSGTNFGLMNGVLFKPDYLLEPKHDIIPYAGIDLNDNYYNVNIGDGNDPNYFSTLNNGIITHNSSATISNCNFTTIVNTNYYPENWQGSAIAGIGSLYNSITNSLDVNSATFGQVQISNCYRGIYAEYSYLNADNVTMDRMRTGIEANFCTNAMSTSVTNCTINATKIGINFWDNDGARGMFADNNNITMSGNVNSVAINASEFNGSSPGYSITNNNINMVSGAIGVHLANLGGAAVTNNIIGQSINVNNINSTGVLLENVVKSDISCNNIVSARSYVNSIGINTNMSTDNAITCNILSQNTTGASFGGSCLGTTFQGNNMTGNFLGLYLNDQAVIGQQFYGTHQHGNNWVAYRGPIGALNSNNTFFGALYSEFDVSTSEGQVITSANNWGGVTTVEYYPLLNFSNDSAHWFVKTFGTPYSCSANTNCTNFYSGGGGGGGSSGSISTSPLRAIVLDSIQTLVYNSETRAQTQEYLYNKIMTDTSIVTSDSVLALFANDAANQPTGLLYEADQHLSKIGYYSPNTLIQIVTVDSLIKANKDSASHIDLYHVQNYDRFKDSLRYRLGILTQTRSNILLLRNADVLVHLQAADSINSAVVSDRLPEANERVINSLYLSYYRYGKRGIQDRYNDLLNIATQCPFAGGKAVYEARPLVALFNDSMVYDDNAVCLQSGIYRLANHTTEQVAKNLQEIILQPNPAKDQVNVVLKNSEDGICVISILNSFGTTMLTEKMDCNTKSKMVNTEQLNAGVYFVKVEKENGWVKTLKLIIAR